jgi:hypothetical protein
VRDLGCAKIGTFLESHFAPVIVTQRVAFILSVGLSCNYDTWLKNLTFFCKVFKIITKDLGDIDW